ncbi:MAG TPA: hypothetical protein VMW56_05920 [Candidatus Margulisiibacteriota bacterium]|nr:hypothetical protein [Candidatus Margulisiibacteriota bacterium]
MRGWYRGKRFSGFTIAHWSLRSLVVLAVANGIVLCFCHYLSFRSLWLDEAFVAVNLRHRSLGGLFSTLEYGQQFPRLYLASIWVLTRAGGYELWSLRLLPLIFGIAGLLLWSKLLWDEFNVSASLPFLSAVAVFLFLTNRWLFYFPGELKQYSSDLLFSAYALWYARRFIVQESQRSVAGLSAVYAGWVAPTVWSLTYAFVLLPVAAVIFVPLLLKRPPARHGLLRVGLLGGFVLLGLSLSFALDLRYVGPELNSYFQPWFIAGSTWREWARSAWTGIANVVGGWWIESTSPVLTLIGFLGVGCFVSGQWKGRDSLLLGGGVLILAELVMLAVLQRYPLEHGRTALFFFPFAVGLICNGIGLCMNAKWRVVRLAGYVLLIATATFTLVSETPKVSRWYYQFDHWQNLNPAFEALNPRKATLVAYGDGTRAQIDACPHLPTAFTFVYAPDLSGLSPEHARRMTEGDFYYLYAHPTGDLQRFTGMINAVRPHMVQRVVRHLYFFKNSQFPR